MTDSKVCSIPGCGKRFVARGFCGMHYQRFKKYGDPGKLGCLTPGVAMNFLEEFLTKPHGDECEQWPFTKSAGRAIIGHGRKRHKVCRIICERIYGEPPTPVHEAAHSCGNGHIGCVNPKHLRWATPSENAQDKSIHGTQKRGEATPSSKLTDEDVAFIKQNLHRYSNQELAKRFSVHRVTIAEIRKDRAWRHIQVQNTNPPFRNPAFKLQESDVISIREMAKTKSQSQIAAIFGLSQGYVSEILSGRRWRRVADREERC